jgi:hypothetical protein
MKKTIIILTFTFVTVFGAYAQCEADAGPDKDVCGFVDTLNAVTTYGGYWEVINYPENSTNCSVLFYDPETGEPNIYHPNAVVLPTCYGEHHFVWHEINGDCEDVDTVTFNFTMSSITLPELAEQPTCLNQVQTRLDTTGFSQYDWYWRVDTSFIYEDEIDLWFNPYECVTVIERNFPDQVFGDSGYVEIPLTAFIILDGCTHQQNTSVTFYQKPSENVFPVDTIISGSNITLNVEPSSINSSALWMYTDFSYMPYPDNQFAKDFAFDAFGNYSVVFSEENTLGYNHPSCMSKDTVVLSYMNDAPINFSFLVDTSNISLPFVLNSSSIANTSTETGTYVWSIYSGGLVSEDNLLYQSNDAVPNYTFEEAGVYVVVLELTNYRSVNSIAKYATLHIQDNTSSINKLLFEQQVFPNPTSGKIQIDIEEVEAAEVYDSRGNLILNTKETTLDLSEQTKGIYYLKIKSNKSVTNQKVVLE